MRIEIDKYRAAVADYEEVWRELDEVLYDVCRRHPGHADLAGVLAKVYVIGRSYTTQIERHITGDGTQGGALMKVIKHLHDQATAVDALLDELRALHEPLTPAKLTSIASIHGRFVRVVAGVTRDQLSTPSFGSKYLHFHNSVVPIYDSVAVAQLGKDERWKKSMSCFDVPPEADPAYARYLARMWPLYQQAIDLKLPVSVKYIDWYAMSLASAPFGRFDYSPCMTGDDSMTFNVSEYRKAANEYDQTWLVLDAALYDLCRKHPDHSAWDGLCAKLWIIGRTYATGIERKVKTKGTQGSSMSQVADHLYKHRRRIDNIIIEPLREMREPFTQQKAQVIVDLHGQFTGLLTPITRNNQSPRSFASKYLHFHAPVVPIIDSYADHTLPGIVRLRPDLRVFRNPKNGDYHYYKHVLRFLRLHEMAAAAGVKATVKRLDAYLLLKAGRAGEARAEAAVMGAA